MAIPLVSGKLYNLSMLVLTEEDVLRHLPMADAVRLVEDTFVRLATGEAVNQPRRRLMLPTGSVLHQLAGAWGGYFGTKIYSTHPKHGAHFHVLLYDAATARPLALFDANHLGQIRTGAASGVATRLMAREDATVLAVIGAGFQAETQLAAIRAVRPIREARVWSRNAGRRRAFADRFGAVAPETAEEAVRGADIVVTITFSKDPVVDAAWIAPGCHVNAAGSNNPTRRELPADLLAAAARIAVDSRDQARIESGDLLLGGVDLDSPRVVELQEIAAGRLPGRTSPGEITVFKSNGLGVQDVAVAAHIYERVLAERK
ncbi:MAG: ornithine cyclodeaminase family protein [Bryobacteraceae bacterium]